MFFPRLVFASIFIASCLTTSTLGATLANNEVEALKIIGAKLGKNWKFSVDPCSGDDSWEEIVYFGTYYENNVTCDCSFDNNTTCHVVSIDLTRNYLSDMIPSGWGSMQLVSISLLGNRLTGPIPEELANISSLTTLDLGNNNFSGNLPPAIGSLPKIEAMLLNSNHFTGKLPETFAKLTTLKTFGISDNNSTGKIPEFIFRKWPKLENIYIEASGLSGPVPTIDSLENLKYIIISDLNGAEATFPQLSNLPNLSTL